MPTPTDLMDAPPPARVPPRRRKSILDVGRSLFLGFSSPTTGGLRRGTPVPAASEEDFETGGISPAEVTEKARKKRFANLNYERSLSLDERTLKTQQAKMRSRQGRGLSELAIKELDIVVFVISYLLVYVYQISSAIFKI